MIFYYIIAECEDDYIDYLSVYNIPESESRIVSKENDLVIFRNRPIDIHFLHITKFAAKIAECKTKFIDLQIALSQNLTNVKTCIEAEDGLVVSANISFLKL
jgi:hypothetical protein